MAESCNRIHEPTLNGITGGIGIGRFSAGSWWRRAIKLDRGSSCGTVTTSLVGAAVLNPSVDHENAEGSA